MPLISLQISESSIKDKTEILGDLNKIVSKYTGKPENYCMAKISAADIMMGSESENAAFAEIRSIGALTPETTKNISNDVCYLLSEKLGVPKDRVYLNFTEFDRSKWGWNGTTF
jgi:phenylpyruvate tautomerase PptA (4-oxalocrotonate tautomerase family)